MKRALYLTPLVVIGLAVAFVRPPSVPDEKIASAVSHDQALIANALAPHYQQPLHYQRNGSVCGPASLVNVLRSFGENYGDERAITAGSGKCWSGMCFLGLSLDELADIARLRTKHRVTVLRDLDKEAFKTHLTQVYDPGKRYVVNFTRQAIFAAGGGHHSPLGGYLPEQDLVLVLDVNEKFKPWLVEADRLFAAIDTVDTSSGKKRGLLLIDQ